MCLCCVKQQGGRRGALNCVMRGVSGERGLWRTCRGATLARRLRDLVVVSDRLTSCEFGLERAATAPVIVAIHDDHDKITTLQACPFPCALCHRAGATAGG